MLIVFIGPPGVGKGTQCRRLLAHLNVPHLSTGELLREAIRGKTEIGRQSSVYMDQGKLVPDSFVLTLVREKLKHPEFSRGCLFDGFPRSLGQARALDQLLEERGTPINLVLELIADEEVLIDRMHKRAVQENRADDNPQTIAHRMEVFHQQTAPLRDYYRTQGKLVNIHALGTPDEVFERVRAAVDARRPPTA
jgi:adenylate kinase